MDLSQFLRLVDRGVARDLEDLDFRERNDEPPATLAVFCLPAKNPFLEMPRQKQEVVGLHGSGLGLRNDGNTSSRGETAELILVDLSNRQDLLGTQAAILQNYVSFGGSTIPENFFPVRLQGLDQPR